MALIESLRSYALRYEKALIPMAKGSHSGRMLRIALDISGIYSTEITAFTVRGKTRAQFWTDNVNLVTEVYEAGRKNGVKVIPKIVTSDSVREAILRETEFRSYDLLMVGIGRRAPLSGSLFGNIGDHLFKNVHTTVVMLSISDDLYPYSSVIAPVSEDLSTRHSVSLAMNLKKAMGSRLILQDLRKYDRKPTHGFRTLLESIHRLNGEFGEDISYIRSGSRDGSLSDLSRLGSEMQNSLAVLGVRTGRTGSVRVNSAVKNVIKYYPGDVMVVKKG